MAYLATYSNVVLGSTIERRVVAAAGVYHDVPIGVFIIRGENIVLMGTHESNRHIQNFTHVEKQEFDEHWLKQIEKENRLAAATRLLLGSDGLVRDEDDLV